MTALENVHDLEGEGGGVREHEEGGRESERERTSILIIPNTYYIKYLKIDHIFTSLLSLPSPLSLFLFHAPLSFPAHALRICQYGNTI